MSTTSTYCQRSLTTLGPQWEEFLHDIQAELSLGKNPLRLFLPQKLIPILLYSLGEKNQTNILVEIPQDLRIRADLAWHMISMPLSDQELDGVIHTPLSNAYHALLSTSSHGRFLIPNSMMRQAIPSRKAYRDASTTLTQGQRITLSALSAKLVQAGYIRYAKQASVGGFHIVGDTIDILMPLGEHPIRIEMFGSHIERITHAKERRSSIINSITILPIRFPKETSILSEIISGIPRIALNNPHPDIPTPKDILEAKLPPYPLAQQHGSSQTYSSSIGTARALELIGRLTPGKPAVHADHGIGIYEGLERRTIGGSEIEYIILRYAGGDSIAIPVPFAHKVSPYIGENAPAVYRLGGTLWSKTKKRAQEDAAEFARELL